MPSRLFGLVGGRAPGGRAAGVGQVRPVSTAGGGRSGRPRPDGGIPWRARRRRPVRASARRRHVYLGALEPRVVAAAGRRSRSQASLNLLRRRSVGARTPTAPGRHRYRLPACRESPDAHRRGAAQGNRPTHATNRSTGSCGRAIGAAGARGHPRRSSGGTRIVPACRASGCVTVPVEPGVSPGAGRDTDRLSQQGQGRPGARAAAGRHIDVGRHRGLARLRRPGALDSRGACTCRPYSAGAAPRATAGDECRVHVHGRVECALTALSVRTRR